MRRISLVLFSMLFFSVIACKSKDHYVPKPSTYLEISFPERNHVVYKDACGYLYSKPTYFDVKNVGGSACNRDIDLGSLNGVVHISRMDMDTVLAAYVNYAIDKVEEHKVKASAIFDSTIVRENERVFGTFFELQGNVASPFQFYLTDSTSRFLSGVVYFNSRPNYDSLKPVLNFVKKDILEMMHTLEWE